MKKIIKSTDDLINIINRKNDIDNNNNNNNDDNIEEITESQKKINKGWEKIAILLDKILDWKKDN